MKIFLTGGTGFIGTHFLRSPHGRSHEILALRRPGSSCCLPLRNEPTWVSGGLDTVAEQRLAGCDALVHLASPGVSPKKADWEELFKWNVTETLRLVDSARRAGVRRVVVAGTFAEYGRSADRFDPIPPEAPLEPTYGYAASKAAASVALNAYAIEHGVELAYLRVFSAFGDGQFEANFWPALKKAALAGNDFPMTSGEQVRDYMPVEDVASCFWTVVTRTVLTPGRPLTANVGSGRAVSMRDFAEEWWARFQAAGSLQIGALPYRSNEVMKFIPLVSPL